MILVFLAYSRTGMNIDVDDLLQRGTDLFMSIGIQQHLLISELPTEISIVNRSFSVTYLEPRSGMVSQKNDDANSLSFTITSALRNGLADSNACFLTIGNNPGVTVGIFKKDDGNMLVFDSHSRDQFGRCCPNGKAVLLELTSLQGLSLYVRDMARSLSSTRSLDQLFEVTPALFQDKSGADDDGILEPPEVYIYILN